LGEVPAVIIEWIWAQICAFLGWLLSLFPTITLPSWFTTINGYIADGVEVANGLSNWVPLDALRNAFLFLMGLGMVVLAVRAFRIGLSLFTGGGGGAA
jgi:hypothetical protein